MDASGSGGSVRKQEDTGDDPNREKRDIKPVLKTLNRVPRMSVFYKVSTKLMNSILTDSRSLRGSRFY
jgi:hypothetical protein